MELVGDAVAYEQELVDDVAHEQELQFLGIGKMEFLVGIGLLVLVGDAARGQGLELSSGQLERAVRSGLEQAAAARRQGLERVVSIG